MGKIMCKMKLIVILLLAFQQSLGSCFGRRIQLDQTLFDSEPGKSAVNHSSNSKILDVWNFKANGRLSLRTNTPDKKTRKSPKNSIRTMEQIILDDMPLSMKPQAFMLKQSLASKPKTFAELLQSIREQSDKIESDKQEKQQAEKLVTEFKINIFNESMPLSPLDVARRMIENNIEYVQSKPNNFHQLLTTTTQQPVNRQSVESIHKILHEKTRSDKKVNGKSKFLERLQNFRRKLDRKRYGRVIKTDVEQKKLLNRKQVSQAKLQNPRLKEPRKNLTELIKRLKQRNKNHGNVQNNRKRNTGKLIEVVQRIKNEEEDSIEKARILKSFVPPDNKVWMNSPSKSTVTHPPKSVITTPTRKEDIITTKQTSPLKIFITTESPKITAPSSVSGTSVNSGTSMMIQPMLVHENLESTMPAAIIYETMKDKETMALKLEVTKVPPRHNEVSSENKKLTEFSVFEESVPPHTQSNNINCDNTDAVTERMNCLRKKLDRLKNLKGMKQSKKVEPEGSKSSSSPVHLNELNDKVVPLLTYNDYGDEIVSLEENEYPNFKEPFELQAFYHDEQKEESNTLESIMILNSNRAKLQFENNYRNNSEQIRNQMSEETEERIENGMQKFEVSHDVEMKDFDEEPTGEVKVSEHSVRLDEECCDFEDVTTTTEEAVGSVDDPEESTEGFYLDNILTLDEMHSSQQKKVIDETIANAENFTEKLKQHSNNRTAVENMIREMVSHDPHTLINSLVNMINISDSDVAEKEKVNLHEMIVNDANALSKIVTDLIVKQQKSVSQHGMINVTEVMGAVSKTPIVELKEDEKLQRIITEKSQNEEEQQVTSTNDIEIRLATTSSVTMPEVNDFTEVFTKTSAKDLSAQIVDVNQIRDGEATQLRNINTKTILENLINTGALNVSVEHLNLLPISIGSSSRANLENLPALKGGSVRFIQKEHEILPSASPLKVMSSHPDSVKQTTDDETGRNPDTKVKTTPKNLLDVDMIRDAEKLDVTKFMIRSQSNSDVADFVNKWRSTTKNLLKTSKSNKNYQYFYRKEPSTKPTSYIPNYTYTRKFVPKEAPMIPLTPTEERSLYPEVIPTLKPRERMKPNANNYISIKFGDRITPTAVHNKLRYRTERPKYAYTYIRRQPTSSISYVKQRQTHFHPTTMKMAPNPKFLFHGQTSGDDQSLFAISQRKILQTMNEINKQFNLGFVENHR